MDLRRHRSGTCDGDSALVYSVAMFGRRRSVIVLWFTILGALVLIVAACAGDDDDAGSAPTDAASDADATGTGTAAPEGPEIEGAVGDDDLLVPRQYLQGEWCDSDGNSWSIEGDTARFVESGGGGTAELPVDLAFIDSPDVSLVSQTDDQFVVGSGGDEVTFARGSC